MKDGEDDKIDPVFEAFRGFLEALRVSLRAELRAELLKDLRGEFRADNATGLWISRKEAARRACVSRATLDRWLADPASGLGALTARPLGTRRVLIPAAAFRDWLRDRSGPGVAGASP